MIVKQLGNLEKIDSGDRDKWKRNLIFMAQSFEYLKKGNWKKISHWMNKKENKSCAKNRSWNTL